MKDEYKELLLKVARAAIFQGLDRSEGDPPLLARIPAELMEERASFVTLEIRGVLRGCIGTLDAYRPLVSDVEENARASAFKDPRFPPVTREEFESIEIHISVLSPPEEIMFSSEQNLIDQIRPGADGLILEDEYHRGTFLPSVWEQLPDTKQFLAHLKMKAGLPDSHEVGSMRIFRYTAEYFGE